MRRIGLWLALLLLLAGTWGVSRWLRGARTVEAPTASHETRTIERVEDPHIDRFADVSSQDVGREALDVAVLPPSESAAPAGTPETVCVVRVVDTLDAAISGARVAIAQRPEIAPQITDSDGRCRMKGDINVLFMTAVGAAADGYFPASEMFTGQEELVVHLRPAALASGRVLERATRAPIAGARVGTRAPGGWAGDVEAGFAISDAGGRFEGLPVPRGQSFLVDVQARGYLWPRPLSMSVAGEADVPGSTLELLLDPAKPGYVQVVDGEDGRPLPGARVSMGRTTLETDADGRACFESELPPSDLVHWATASADEHCGARFELQGSGTPDAPVVIRLPRACRVEGVVRAAGDAEIPQCWLRVDVEGDNVANPVLPEGIDRAGWPDNAKWSGIHLRTTFDERIPGRIAIDGVPAGLPALTLTLFHEAGTLGKRRIGPVGSSGTTLRFDWVLDPAGTAVLKGRVLLNGEPHTASVHVQQDGFDRVSTTGDDGRYAFEELPAGTLELRCELRSEGLNWGDLGVLNLAVDVAPGASAQQDLQFRIAIGTISGTVSDANGAPLAGVRVQVAHSVEGIVAGSSSASDGTWSLRVPVVETPYEVSCFRIKLREPQLEVFAGTEGIALHALARGRLRFRVLDAATGGVVTAPALARPRAGNVTQSIGGSAWPGMEASGWCEVELPEGPLELAAYTHDGRHRADRRRVEIPADGVCEAEFRLGPAVAIELRLAPEGGPLPKNHVVLLLPEAEWELATAKVGAGYPQVSFDALPFDPMRKQDLGLWPGRGVEVGGLAPGRYRFKVFPDDVAIEPEWIDVPAPGVVDLRWSAKP